MKDHLKPQPILIAKRYKFYTRDQKQDESVSEYIAELRKVSLYCEFKAFVDDALRDKFVCGLKKSNIRRRLLTKKALTLQTAVEIAKNLDQAEFENELIMTEGKSGKYYTETYALCEQNRGGKRCYRCNSEYHLANNCSFREMICNKCKVKGHLSRVCRGKATVPWNNNPDKGTCVNERTNYNTERNQNNSDSDDEKTVYYVKKISHKKPLEVVIKVDKQDIRFEVDTGSGIS